VSPLEAIMSGVMTILSYSMVVAVVWKLFQVATDLGQIKALLTEMHRAQTASMPKPLAPAAPPPPQAGPISLESAEALLREVVAESEHPRTTA
jgi:hypothetical protein